MPIKVEDFDKVKSSRQTITVKVAELSAWLKGFNAKGEYPTTQEVYNFLNGKPLDSPATSKQWDSLLMGELTTLRNNGVIESVRYENTLLWRLKK